MTISKLEKIIAIGTIIGMLVSAVTYLSMFMPDYVEAGEFNELKVEMYSTQLKRSKSELMDLEVLLWNAEINKLSIPETIKKKELQLKDDIKMLENKLNKIENSK